MSKRRGKRIVVGYVVSHTGKRGGPWEGVGGGYGRPTDQLAQAYRLHGRESAEYCAQMAREEGHPHARALPLVRYEVDAEEERLRDAVVEAADAWVRELTTSGIRYASEERFLATKGVLIRAIRALRAHREKVGR